MDDVGRFGDCWPIYKAVEKNLVSEIKNNVMKCRAANKNLKQIS